MVSKTRKNPPIPAQKNDLDVKESIYAREEIKDSITIFDNDIETLCDDNLIMLEKVHAILINCNNLSKKQKIEFCENERFQMKLYLKKLMNKIDK